MNKIDLSKDSIEKVARALLWRRMGAQPPHSSSLLATTPIEEIDGYREAIEDARAVIIALS